MTDFALLSRPTDAVVEHFGRRAGDVLLLGAGGKIGPSLASWKFGGLDQRRLSATNSRTPGLYGGPEGRELSSGPMPKFKRR